MVSQIKALVFNDGKEFPTDGILSKESLILRNNEISCTIPSQTHGLYFHLVPKWSMPNFFPCAQTPFSDDERSRRTSSHTTYNSSSQSKFKKSGLQVLWSLFLLFIDFIQFIQLVKPAMIEVQIQNAYLIHIHSFKWCLQKLEVVNVFMFQLCLELYFLQANTPREQHVHELAVSCSCNKRMHWR